MAERRCANCPPEPVKPVLPPLSGLVAADSKRLWHHALVTVNAAVEMMRTYAVLGATGGDPVSLRRLASSLLEIAQTVGENNANSPAI